MSWTIMVNRMYINMTSGLQSFSIFVKHFLCYINNFRNNIPLCLTPFKMLKFSNLDFYRLT